MPNITVDLRANRSAWSPSLIPEPTMTPVSEIIEAAETNQGRVEGGPDPFFPVEIKPLRVLVEGVSSNRSVGDMQMIVAPDPHDFGDSVFYRDDTFRTIAVHGNQYRLVTNRQVADAFDRAVARIVEDMQSSHRVEDSPLEHGRITNFLGDEGARMIRTYTFPNTVTHLAPNLPTCFSIRLLNSYNGTYRAGITGGADINVGYRVGSHDHPLGLTMPTGVQAFGKHTQGLNLERIMGGVRGAYREYLTETNKWTRWNEITVDGEFATALLERHNTSDIAKDHIINMFNYRSRINGRNALEFYLALCNFASSPTTVQRANRENSGVIRINRERWVRQILSSPVWLEATEGTPHQQEAA